MKLSSWSAEVLLVRCMFSRSKIFFSLFFVTYRESFDVMVVQSLTDIYYWFSSFDVLYFFPHFSAGCMFLIYLCWCQRVIAAAAAAHMVILCTCDYVQVFEGNQSIEAINSIAQFNRLCFPVL
jgi:hypothetical protein